MKGLESKDGILRLFGERTVFIPPNIITLLGQIYGEGSNPLLKYLGKKMGRRLIENWEEHLRPKNLEQLTEIFLDMVGNSGWGNFYSEKISEDEIIIRLDDNIAKEEGNHSRDICYFINGLLSGFGEFAFYSAQVIEQDCSVIDNTVPSCRFIIKKRNIELQK